MIAIRGEKNVALWRFTYAYVCICMYMYIYIYIYIYLYIYIFYEGLCSCLFFYLCILYQWNGHVTRMGEERGVYRFLVGKPERKRPLGRPRHRWVDNIRMDLQKVGCGYMDWIGLPQDRDRWRTFVSAVMNLWVP